MEKTAEIGRVVEMSWDAFSGKDGVVRRPTWADVEARIRALDTPEYSMVVLRAVNEDTLTVAGDAEHGMLVFVSDPRGHHYVLAPPDRRKGKKEIVIGFQPGGYANRILVDVDTAFKVARSFFQTGRADESVEWTQDDSPLE
jgi:hypothetical protein